MQEISKKLLSTSSSINQSFFKRSFDILFSIVLFLTIFSWLFPVIALLIKLNSKGKIFFIQDRIGLNGALFKCYKFRTLPEKLIKEEDSYLTSEHIPVTGTGKWLRKFNLDELPQFINVLKGDMSMVGPRPHALIYHNRYAGYIDNINQRLLVKPGITGLAQVKGYRGDVENEELNKQMTRKRIEFDLIYIEQWSIWIDLKIVFHTFLQMVRIQKPIV